MSYRVKTTTGMLCKKKTTETTLLTGVSAKFCYGEFVALMGGSGCGKSTLLDLLALRKDESGIEGKIWFEGQRRTNLESQHAVYLMQSDISMENLTVFETLKFAAQFRLPEDTPNDELEAIVNQLLRELRLSHVANTRVGGPLNRGISGGEHRRLAIAESLVNNPKILFLDEPTSGLDSTAAFSVIKLLRDLSRSRNQLIVCSIHQPSSQLLGLFDKMLLLAKNSDNVGQPAYFGPITELPHYLARQGFPVPPEYNLAEFAIELASYLRYPKMIAHKAVEGELQVDLDDADVEPPLASHFGAPNQDLPDLPLLWSNAPELRDQQAEVDQVVAGLSAESDVKVSKHAYATSLGYQMKTFTHRAFLEAFRQPAFVFNRLIKVHVIGFMMATLYPQLDIDDPTDLQNLVSLIFFSLLCTILLGQVFIPLFIITRPLTSREREAKLYGAFTQFIGSIIANLPVEILNSAVFITYIYFICGLRVEALPFFSFLTLFLATSIWSCSLVLFISSVSATVFLSFFMMFCGYFVLLEGMPVWWRYWAPYISPLHYSLSAAMFTQFFERDFNAANGTCAAQSSGDQLLGFYGVTISNWQEMWGYTGIVGLFALAYLIGTYFVLRNCKWSSRR